MSKLNLKGKELRAIGYPEGPVISIAMNIMEKKHKHSAKEDVMNILKAILASPVEYANDAVLGLIAQQLMPKKLTEGIELLGGGSDEAPHAYKDIEEVMHAQKQLDRYGRQIHSQDRANGWNSTYEKYPLLKSSGVFVNSSFL